MDAALWKAVTTPEGKTYFYNASTKETSWTKPDAMKTPLEAAPQPPPQQAAAPITPHPLPPSAIGSTLPPTNQQYPVPSAVAAGGVQPPQPQQQPAVLQSAFPGAGRPLPQSVIPNRFQALKELRELKELVAGNDGMEEVVFSSRQEAIAAFNQILVEAGVTGRSTWEDTLKVIISKKNYRALKTLAERKEAFVRFQEQLILKEKEEFRARLDKNRVEFRQVVDRRKDIDVNTAQWKVLLQQLKHEPIIRKMTEEEGEMLFDEYLVELRRKQKEEARLKRRANLELFRSILTRLTSGPQPQITLRTPWREAQAIYSLEPELNNDTTTDGGGGLQSMDKIDFLSVFESHMKQLEGEYNEARKRVRDIKWRHARKCRAVFKECLSELYSNGNIIGMGTKWKDVYPLIKSDVRFLDMLGLNGSTPLELFWDLIMVEGERFEADRKIVMSIVKEKNVNIQPNDSFELFAALFEDEIVAGFANNSLKLCFEELLDKAVQREKEEKKRAERKLKKKIDAFRYALKKSTPFITNVETSWDDVKDRFIGQEDYERLNEEQRQQAFAKFIARLHEKQSLAILSAEEGQDDDEGNRRRRDKDHQQHKKRSRRHGGDSDLSDASDVIAGKRGSKRHRSDAGGGEKGDNHSSDSGEDYGRGSGGGGRLTRKRASPERGASYGGRTLVSYDDDIEEGEVR